MRQCQRPITLGYCLLKRRFASNEASGNFRARGGRHVLAERPLCCILAASYDLRKHYGRLLITKLDAAER
jgi:hypothetical protein